MCSAGFTNATFPVNFARDARAFTSPSLMPHSHSTELRVRYAETDRMGVVYYANYLIWCEVGRVEFMRALGRGYAALEAEGTGLAVAEAKVRYLAPARFDDLVRVETTLTGVRSRAVTFDYVITNAESGLRLATAHTALVSIAKDGRLTAIPSDFRTALEATL
jgi:acyl-CoA thioester hydrolase